VEVTLAGGQELGKKSNYRAGEESWLEQIGEKKGQER